MSSPSITNRQLIELVKVYWQWRTLWIMTTFAFGSLGLVYAVFLKADTWVASQGLIVRDEANGGVMRLGRFQSQTEMKTAQETIQEMARNTQVLQDALTKVGPVRDWWSEWLERPNSSTWPSRKTIEDLAKDGIEVRAPRGAEFGTTEVIYLDIKQDSGERAVELNKAVCDGLENHLQGVRQARADGVIAELLTAKIAGEKALAEATDRLQKIETEAGPDLPDLRGLTDTSGGGNTNKQMLDSIKSEVRLLELKLGQLEIDMQLARESLENPDALLLTPGRLVTDQPGLKKLREGLADATIKTSELKGRFTEANPLVKAAVETESRIRQQLKSELRIAVASMSRDLEINSRQLVALGAQQSQLEARLNKIAGIRAEYANVVSDVRARSNHLQELQRELAEAEAARDAAAKSSLLTRLDAPILGERPLGPGRTTIVVGSVVSGLFFGLGLVFLLTPLDGSVSYGRRRQDLLGRGRRREDLTAHTALSSEVRDRRENKESLSEPVSGSATTDSQTPTREAGERIPSPATAETLATVKLRASDVLAPRGQPARPQPARAQSSPEPAISTSLKLSELSNAPPQPIAQPGQPTEAVTSAAAPQPAAVSNGSNGSNGSPFTPRQPAVSENPVTEKPVSQTPVCDSKLRPTPWTSSRQLKAAANDPRFANNRLLDNAVRGSTIRSTTPTIEVIEPRTANDGREAAEQVSPPPMGPTFAKSTFADTNVVPPAVG